MNRSIIIFKTFIRLFIKDKVNLFFTFFFNAFLMVIFGLTVDDRYNLTVDMGVVDYQQSEKSHRFTSYLDAQDNVNLLTYADKNELKGAIENGTLVVGMLLEDAAGKDGGSKITIVGDPSRKMWMEFMEPGLRLAAIESDINYIEKQDKTDISVEYIESKNLTYFDFIFPGLLAFALMQTGLSGGLCLLSQRCNQSLRRLKITPLKKSEFLFGYAMSYSVILIVQTIFYIAMGVGLLGYSFTGNVFSVGLVAALTGFLFLAFGVLLSTWASTVEVGSNFNRFFTFPTAFLCGVFMPLDSLPEYLQKLSLIHPLTHLVEIIRGVANYSESLAAHALSLILLVATTLIVCILAVILFRWEEKTA